MSFWNAASERWMDQHYLKWSEMRIKGSGIHARQNSAPKICRSRENIIHFHPSFKRDVIFQQ